MFTRISNFSYGNTKIANIDSVGINSNFELKIYIKKYEEQCLRLILGDALYLELMANVELDSNEIYVLKDTAVQKWKDLLYGKNYPSVEHKDQHTWEGLVKNIGRINDIEIHETIMASYVFYHWSLANRTNTTGTGESRGQSQGSTQESSKYKRIDVWNEFRQKVCVGLTATNVSLNLFLYEHQVEFPTAQRAILNALTYYDI